MNELETMYQLIKLLWEEFEINHKANIGGNKSAGARARKSLGEIKKIITPYRKKSNDANR